MPHIQESCTCFLLVHFFLNIDIYWKQSNVDSDSDTVCVESHNVKILQTSPWKKINLKWRSTKSSSRVIRYSGEHPICIWLTNCYCVEISDTIVCMMRDPLGQLIRSILGFLIFSSKSWSSSHRSSFTSSATYINSLKLKITTIPASIAMFMFRAN